MFSTEWILIYIISIVFASLMYYSFQLVFPLFLRLKFLINLIDLLILKLKINANKWTLDEKFTQSILYFIKKIKRNKRIVYFELTFQLCIFILSICLLTVIKIDYPSIEAFLSLLIPIFLPMLNLWWIPFLIIFIFKSKQIEKNISTASNLSLKKIKAEARQKFPKDDFTGLPFIIITKQIFTKKVKTMILNEYTIREHLGKQAKSIMYLYIYDLDNFKAPYFVFDHKDMMQNYGNSRLFTYFFRIFKFSYFPSVYNY
ncbi:MULTISPECIES: hypothetical protein [unclassified Mycoplasma]|uniref:hypothetical protein n=1 Tax=unclassified Mycoplasma TaxID=2683645 RepID=UPI00211C2EE8|nr:MULTISPECIES: hypothetical protein [unclassified Mycoplasma]UUM19918.1 hypothetical protein NPA11_00560 [Mycoplasma sp. 1578d]UUM24898.1 hypothetical protein NPA12_00540 [Mycoplasma sp. 3686d]